MTVTSVFRGVTAVLAGLAMLLTLAGLALLVSGPLAWTAASSGHGRPAYAGFGEVWTSWQPVAICAGIAVALGFLAIRLRRAS